jgi:hypothetical protein
VLRIVSLDRMFRDGRRVLDGADLRALTLAQIERHG